MSQSNELRHLVAPGATFAMSTGDGRYGVVRVLRVCAESKSSLVSVTPWLQDRLPSLDEPVLRTLLRQYRHKYRGEPSICWYSGGPSSAWTYLGVIPLSAEELEIDPRSYGGQWHGGIILPVVWERDPDSSAQVQAFLREHDPYRVRALVKGRMTDDEFWRAIDTLDWTSADSTVESLVDHLAALPRGKIAGFQRQLTEKLFALDGEKFAREIGEYSFPHASFSVDHFLDVRAAVVANGRNFYDSVLADPTKMPKNVEFESLLSAADLAYRRKTGDEAEFDLPHSIETYSNEAGWPRDQ